MRFTEIKKQLAEGWNTGSDRVQLPDEPSTYWAGSGALQKEYEELYDKLVPAQGKADTIQGEVLRAASKIVYRHYNDGDEFNRASYRQLEPYIGPVTSYDDLAHKATMFALKADGNYTPNQDWDSLDVMDYGPEENDYDDEDDDDWDDEEEDTSWDQDDDEDLDEHWDQEGYDPRGQNPFLEPGQKALKGKAVSKKKATNIAKDILDKTFGGTANDLTKNLTIRKGVDEAANDQVYTVNIVRRSSFGGDSRVRPTSGTLPELLEYFGYTLETGKSYERERGRYKINMNPKTIESLVDNLNKAKSNAAANGHSSTYYEVADEQVAEGWESGPEEYKEPYDDADDAYDRRRQEKLDIEAEKANAKRPQEKVYTLLGRGPNMEPNYKFPGEYKSQEDAIAARKKIMADPDTPHPEHIGIHSYTRYLDESTVTPLRDREDYQAKSKALQDIQMDPDTHKDPQLSAELARRKDILMRQAKQLGIDESRAHKVLNTWFKNKELQDKFAKGELKVPTPQERRAELEKQKTKK